MKSYSQCISVAERSTHNIAEVPPFYHLMPLTFINFPSPGSFDPNPLLRATFWSYFIGGYFRAFKSYIGEQICIQRYCVTKSKKILLWSVISLKTSKYQSKRNNWVSQELLTRYINYYRSVALQIPLCSLIMSLFASIGITMSAYYIGCDPLENGEIEKSDQVQLSSIVLISLF